MKMLKKFAVLFSAVIMCVCCSPAVSAENTDKVVDEADLLTDSEESALEEKILEIIEKYDYEYDIVIVSADSTDGKSVTAYADDFYDYNGYGYGSYYNGVMFLLNMEGRDWYISTCGKGITVFTDYGIDQIGNTVLPYLKNGDYYDAFEEFADEADRYINKYETDGKPYDKYGSSSPRQSLAEEYGYGSLFLTSLVTGLIIALIVCLIMKAQLKTAVKQFGAKSYIKPGSLNVSYSRDIYLYKNVTKHKIESSSGRGSGGGSSIHTSSSGRSHGGGGGKF